VQNIHRKVALLKKNYILQKENSKLRHSIIFSKRKGRPSNYMNSSSPRCQHLFVLLKTIRYTVPSQWAKSPKRQSVGVFLTTRHCILSAELTKKLTKTHSFSNFDKIRHKSNPCENSILFKVNNSIPAISATDKQADNFKPAGGEEPDVFKGVVDRPLLDDLRIFFIR